MSQETEELYQALAPTELPSWYSIIKNKPRAIAEKCLYLVNTEAMKYCMVHSAPHESDMFLAEELLEVAVKLASKYSLLEMEVGTGNDKFKISSK